MVRRPRAWPAPSFLADAAYGRTSKCSLRSPARPRRPGGGHSQAPAPRLPGSQQEEGAPPPAIVGRGSASPRTLWGQAGAGAGTSGEAGDRLRSPGPRAPSASPGLRAHARPAHGCWPHAWMGSGRLALLPESGFLTRRLWTLSFLTQVSLGLYKSDSSSLPGLSGSAKPRGTSAASSRRLAGRHFRPFLHPGVAAGGWRSPRRRVAWVHAAVRPLPVRPPGAGAGGRAAEEQLHRSPQTRAPTSPPRASGLSKGPEREAPEDRGPRQRAGFSRRRETCPRIITSAWDPAQATASDRQRNKAPPRHGTHVRVHVCIHVCVHDCEHTRVHAEMHMRV